MVRAAFARRSRRIGHREEKYRYQYRERGYSVSLEYLLKPELAVGASSLLTFANEDRFTQVRRALRHAQSLHGRAALSERTVLLAEMDLLKQAGRALGYAGRLQADYEPLHGLHVMLTVELFDQGQLDGAETTPGNGEARVGAWASLAWYCLSHGELRLDALQRRESPFTVQAQASATPRAAVTCGSRAGSSSPSRASCGGG